jgi:hypothetical protein
MVFQGIDPRRLRASFELGKNLTESATDDEQKINGARLVNSSAILGYEPARMLIAREYPRSHVIQIRGGRGGSSSLFAGFSHHLWPRRPEQPPFVGAPGGLFFWAS